MRLRTISELRDGQKPQKWFTDEYVDPDTWYGKDDAVAFIYNPDGTLHVGDAHYDIIGNAISYYENEYKDYANEIDINELNYSILPKHALLGRISPLQGDNYRVVSFWNSNELSNLLPTCLKTLVNDDFLSLDDVIAAGDRHMYVMDYLRGGRFEYNADEEDRKQKMRELHLMRPNQKKQAMKALGLDAASRKQPWQKSAEQHKLVRPGQKWWAMQSEGHDAS